MPADNKRFGKIGVKVIARTLERRLTVSDNPNGVQSSPNFVKPPGRYTQAKGFIRDIGKTCKAIRAGLLDIKL